ncbi:hypothetical protein Pan97_02540 [Bremerella volcania]|uniref:Uncharacterized protein n=1 Tax=Bremerella volcania TaxID=2527984 RepID=A0A518C236_9BACT|nr:hypothetical protein [Bremerella volcania]QDU73286.1 hypothetical protein Pan97_02540 [Bremerella volcania]
MDVKHLHSTFFLLLWLNTCPVYIFAADSDKVPDPEIIAAKEVFEENIDSAKKHLLERLETKLEFAQRRGELELVESVVKEIEAFKGKGILPTVVPADGYVTTFERALTQLENAYDQVVRRYVREGLLDDARYLQDEIKKIKALPSNHPTYANAEIVVKSGASSLQNLKNGVRAFSDRSYKWVDIPDDFPFKQFAQVQGEGTKPIHFQVKTPGVVYIALSNEHPTRVTAFIREYEWAPTGFRLNHTAKTGKPVDVFMRNMDAGEYHMPRVNFSGPTLLSP